MNRILQPFKYIGGKTKLSKLYAPLFPPHRHFVSVFGGSAAEIINKPISPYETYNDVNSNLTNFFSVLRDARLRRQLCRLLEYTPPSRRDYGECISILRGGQAAPVERAWAFAVVGNQTLNGKDPTIASPGSWRSAGSISYWARLPQSLDELAIRFRRVRIENRPWQRILRKKGKGGYDGEGTFFFMDPPYFPATLNCLPYACMMTEAEHEELLTSLQSLAGKVMICGYDCEMYERYLGGWRQKRFIVKCASSPQKVKPTRTEVIWLNY